MVERHSSSDATSEQQDPGHSPIEDEFAHNRPGTPAEREGIMILGYGLSAVLVAVFALFLIGVVIVIFIT